MIGLDGISTGPPDIGLGTGAVTEGTKAGMAGETRAINRSSGALLTLISRETVPRDAPPTAVAWNQAQ
ncbi:hypothetical protein LP415_08490 [Polaromonas sp. P1(28)-8]|nr:hypothetical protein LP415_08490 [Polaromonas sp. P1(28)-8]